MRFGPEGARGRGRRAGGAGIERARGRAGGDRAPVRDRSFALRPRVRASVARRPRRRTDATTRDLPQSRRSARAPARPAERTGYSTCPPWPLASSRRAPPLALDARARRDDERPARLTRRTDRRRALARASPESPASPLAPAESLRAPRVLSSRASVDAARVSSRRVLVGVRAVGSGARERRTRRLKRRRTREGSHGLFQRRSPGRFDRPRAIGRVLTVSTFDRVPFQPTDEMLSRGIYRPRDVSFAGRRSTETTRDARRDAHHPRATAHEAAHEPAQDASSAAHARAVRPAADGASSARVAPPCRKRAFISFASPRARVRPGRARVSSLRRRADASPPPSRRRSRRRRISGSQSGRTSRRRVHARRDSRARRARARAQFGTASSSRSLARRRRRAASLDGRGDDDSTIRHAAPRRPPLHRGAPRALSRAAPPARVSRAPSPIDR